MGEMMVPQREFGVQFAKEAWKSAEQEKQEIPHIKYYFVICIDNKFWV
jgi:hypothetical protein